jgi:hypothetical protein
MLPVYFRIQIVQITGHHTAPEPGEAVERETAQVEQAGKLSPRGILADLRARLFSK